MYKSNRNGDKTELKKSGSENIIGVYGKKLTDDFKADFEQKDLLGQINKKNCTQNYYNNDGDMVKTSSKLNKSQFVKKVISQNKPKFKEDKKFEHILDKKGSLPNITYTKRLQDITKQFNDDEKPHKLKRYDIELLSHYANRTKSVKNGEQKDFGSDFFNKMTPKTFVSEVKYAIKKLNAAEGSDVSFVREPKDLESVILDNKKGKSLQPFERSLQNTEYRNKKNGYFGKASPDRKKFEKVYNQNTDRTYDNILKTKSTLGQDTTYFSQKDKKSTTPVFDFIAQFELQWPKNLTKDAFKISEEVQQKSLRKSSFTSYDHHIANTDISKAIPNLMSNNLQSRHDCTTLLNWYLENKKRLSQKEQQIYSKLVLSEVIRHDYINMRERGELLAFSVNDIQENYERLLKYYF